MAEPMEDDGAGLPASADTAAEPAEDAPARILTVEAEAAEATVPHEGVALPPEGVPSAAPEPSAEAASEEPPATGDACPPGCR